MHTEAQAQEENFYVRVASVLRMILARNAPTLTEFECMAPFSLLCGNNTDDDDDDEGPRRFFSLPRLPRVTCVSLFYGFTHIMSHLPELNGVTRNFFPAGFQLDDTFPSLSEVILDLVGVPNGNSSPHSWEDLFSAEHTRPAPTVKTLMFKKCDFVPESCMIQCSKLFPNVQNLSLRTYYNNFSYSVKYLWGFKSLRLLRLDIEFANAIPDLPQFQIDSSFTGFSRETVAGLTEAAAQVPVPIETGSLNGLRETTSIVNLEALEALRIEVVDETGILRTNYPHFLSRVTGAFGFAMCPLLNVKLSYYVNLRENLKRLHAAMSPILPFVQLVDNLHDDKDV